MKEKLYNILTIVFMILWMVVIFFDYWQKHPTHYYAFERFHYLDLSIGLLVLSVLGTSLVLFAKNKDNFAGKIVNGFTIFGTLLLVVLLSIVSFQFKLPEPIVTSVSEYFTLLGTVSYTVIATYLLLMFAYALGELFCVLLETSMKTSGQSIINIAAGLMLLSLFLFLFGMFGLLKFYTVFLLLLFLLALNWRGAWKFIKLTLIEPIPLPKDLNIFGVLCFFLLLFFIGLNLVNVISPLPKGYDSLTLYINLPGLIRDYSGLVEGHQPYNWALIMSLGHIIFGKTEVVMAFSSVGGVLSLVAMYNLGKNAFDMGTNYLLAACLVFYATPSIIHQSSDELKVDLGLLFICLCVVLLFVEWLTRIKEDKPKEDEVSSIFYFTGEQIQNGSLIVLAGLLTGFALGIKLTALFLFFSIVAGIWYCLNDKITFLGISFIVLFFVFVLKIDDVSALRQYHLGVEYLQWILLVIGIALLFYSYKKNHGQFMRSAKLTVLYSFLIALPMIPWVSKNYYETRSLSIRTLMNGKSVGPKINFKAIHKNWVEDKKAKKANAKKTNTKKTKKTK